MKIVEHNIFRRLSADIEKEVPAKEEKISDEDPPVEKVKCLMLKDEEGVEKEESTKVEEKEKEVNKTKYKI